LAVAAADRWKLHKYFHHLSSSQALAFNVFFPLYPDVPSGMTATRRVLGLPVDAICRLRFEAVLDAVEGTNIDALIVTDEGTRTIVEVKLTERAFGRAREDDRHLTKLASVYRPLLFGRVDDSCLEPSTFFRDYQLYRNLAQTRRDSSDRVLLLISKARTQLWRHASDWCDSAGLGTLHGCPRCGDPGPDCGAHRRFEPHRCCQVWYC
jgi:restriction endonuclease-like protein